MTSPAADDAPIGASARVVLYGRSGCHLCDEARAVLADVVPDDVGWHEVDVDTDPDLRARYGEYVPVVTVDDVQVGFWRVDPERVRRALGSRP